MANLKCTLSCATGMALSAAVIFALAWVVTGSLGWAAAIGVADCTLKTAGCALCKRNTGRQTVKAFCGTRGTRGGF